ncbi:sialate O-acetylesterase [Bifidobacterium callimiconis]|uniref:sialate O-acetylesterase n=1 Tax=Bifidobacterium callimiconis TaxID=2306973 RepID=UPI001C2F4A35|nr:sialate O-acetylesterase [Bifidobacterium callimiconis]
MAQTSIVTGPAPGSTLSDATAGDAHSAQSGDAVARRNERANFSVAAVFSDHMVLQRHQPVTVFGTATPGAFITVSIALSSEESPMSSGSALADQTGQWTITLPAMAASAAPHRLAVTDGTDAIVFDDVLIGEVWLAGGQSNMELELRNSLHPESTMTEAFDPLLRFYNTPKTGSIDLDAENASGWELCTPDTVGVMSAVGYYFASTLRNGLAAERSDDMDGVPIGIVDCYIGGTSITCWMGRARLEESEAGREYLDRYDQKVTGRDLDEMRHEWNRWQVDFNAWNANIAAAREVDPNATWETLNAQYGECPWPPPMTPFSQYRPCGAFEAMVSRVAPYTIHGVLWYQGEEDEAYCDRYRFLLGEMIDEWRGLWNDASRGNGRDISGPVHAQLPFLIVQLPRWIARTDVGRDSFHWPVIREAQMDAARTIDDVHTVVTLDCGEFDNIHPLDKRTVGERLTAMALARVYDEESVVADALRPVDGPAAATITADGVDHLIVTYAHADSLHFGHYNGDALGTDVDVPLGEPIDADMLPADESGFAVADEHGDWHTAEARILDGHGELGSVPSVMVRSNDVAHPRGVRYGWFSWGPAPLFNEANLPAEPFTISL